MPATSTTIADKAGSLGRVVDGVDDVRRAAREEIKAGAQFIKIMANGGVVVADGSDRISSACPRTRSALRSRRRATPQTYVAAHLYTDEAIRRAVELGVESDRARQPDLGRDGAAREGKRRLCGADQCDV